MKDWAMISNQLAFTAKLAFWRSAAWVIGLVIAHKDRVFKLLPFVPLIGYGSLAHLVGLLVGRLIKVLFI
jgi:hypothetical protein